MACRDEGGTYDWVPGEWPFTNKLYEVFTECPVCTPKKELSRLLRSSRITEEFQHKTFDNFTLHGRPPVIRAAYNAAKDYADRFLQIRNTPANSIALLGTTGAGKTHLLMAVSNRIMTSGVAVLYFPWVSGINELRDFDDKQRQLERIRRLQDVDVLFIDDLFKGRAKPTPFQMEILFDVLNHRYNEKKPFILSSEWNIQKIGDDFAGGDPAIAGRIFERTGGTEGYMVNISGDMAKLNYRLVGL